MFNSYGWIRLGMNRIHLDIMDEEVQKKYDMLDIKLNEKVRKRLDEILTTNEIIRFDYICSMNNLDSFLSLQLSRNHFNSTLREFYKWVSEISDGSHGILHEFNDEGKDFDPNRPYRVWRLIANEFEECEENIINPKYHIVNY